MFSTAMPKPPREPQALLAVALAETMVFMSLPAAAQTTDSWRFQGAVNLYLPDIGGTTAFPILPAGSGDALVDAQTIIDKLKMAAIASTGSGSRTAISSRKGCSRS